MAYEDELITREKMKIGQVYRKELLKMYASDYRAMLVIPNQPPNVFYQDDQCEYKVTNINDDCIVIAGKSRTTLEEHYRSIIFIEKVK